MTASTNAAILRHPNSETEERHGIVYAEEGTVGGTDGVALQYLQQPDEEEPDTEFVPYAELVGVYDEVCDEPATDEFKELING